MDITLADGEIITLGNKLNTQDVVKMVKEDIATLYNKHLRGKPEEIKKMVDQLKRIGFATGTRDGALVGDNITGDSIYGQYLTNLNLSMDKKLREREDMDRILNAPKSMQNAVAMTLFDDRETEFLDCLLYTSPSPRDSV